jgi:hypothetical protein
MCKTWLLLVTGFLAGTNPLFSQERAINVTSCDLLRDAASLDRKVIRIRGRAQLAFEDFSQHLESCQNAGLEKPIRIPSIWLTYGGKGGTPTVYCCGPVAGRRADTLTLEGKPIPLLEEETYQKFDQM